MKQNPIVSIAIPAYNKPEYTRKTLKSIIEQTYRPIEIVLSDDASPEPLEPLVNEIAQHQDQNLTIKFFRQETNLGPMQNIIFSMFKCKGKYMVLLPHDDWFTDPLFIQETIEIMETTSDCNLCCANSIYEDTGYEDTGGRKVNAKLPDYLDAEDSWKIIEGDKYINLLERGISAQAYSAIVCNWEVLKKLGGYQYPFCLDENITKPWGILPDEGFCFQFLLSSAGSVAVTNKVVSICGMPLDSYSKTAAWKNVVGQALFVLMYNVYKADLKGKYSYAAKKRAKEIIFRWPAERINLKLLKHYRFKPEATYLLTKSFLIGFWKNIKKIKHYTTKYLKMAIRDGDYTEISRLYHNCREQVRERGFFSILMRYLTPF